MSGHRTISRAPLAYLALIALLIAFMAIIGLLRWDDTPFAAMGLLFIGAIIPLLWLGFLMFSGPPGANEIPADRLAGWFTILAIVFAVIPMAVGLIAIIDATRSAAGFVWLLASMIGLVFWRRPGWILALLSLTKIRTGVLLLSLVFLGLSILGLVRGDEILASLALFVVSWIALILGGLLLKITNGPVADVSTPPVPSLFWVLTASPFILVIVVLVGIIGIGLDNADSIDVASEPVAIESSPVESVVSTTSTTTVESGAVVLPVDEGEASAETVPVETVEKPTISPGWDLHPEVVGDVILTVPPILMRVNPVQVQSGPNALPDDPYLSYDSVMLGSIELTADQISSLRGRVGSGAAGTYTAISVVPRGEADPTVDYQSGASITPRASATDPTEGQIGVGDSLLNVSVRAFLDETTVTMTIFDPNFNQIDRDIFFTAGNGYRTVFIGNSVAPEGGFLWLNRFGRDKEGLAESPAGWTGLGPIPLGGEFLGGLEISTADPALNCDNLGDYAWCYDGTDIRHIFRFGSCFADSEFDTGVSLYPGPDGDAELPEEPFIITNPETGEQVEIVDGDWEPTAGPFLQQSGAQLYGHVCLDLDVS